MRQPGIFQPIPSAPTEIIAEPGNGKGYWVYNPQNPVAVADGINALKAYGHFTELPQILDSALEHGSVLIEGEPGSGKSHIVRELQEGAQVVGIPTFCLTVHINAGKGDGIKIIAEPLKKFRESCETTGGLLIIDNADYVAYRSRSSHGRRRGATKEYAQDIPILTELFDDPALTVVGTGHDNVWREIHHSWDDPEIDQPAQELLDSFKAKLVFEGRVALVGLVEILRQRNEGVTTGQAARVIRLLREAGRGDFFHANHLDPNLFLSDTKAALAVIDAGRDERKTRARS